MSTVTLETSAATGRAAAVAADQPEAMPRTSVRPSGLMLFWLSCTILMSTAPSIAFPAPGIDPSWMTGLSLATRENLRFGQDFVFPFGPWGFLDVPLHIDRPQAVLGFTFALLATIAAFCATYQALRRNWPDRAAAPAAFAAVLAIASVGSGQKLVCACLLLVVLVLHRRATAEETGKLDYLPGVILAAVSALLIQVKFSEGISAFALTVVAIVGVSSWRAALRNAAASLLTFPLVFLGLWLLAGQRIRDLAAWSRATLEISGGYQQAMARNSLEVWTAYTLVMALAVVAGVAVFRIVRQHRNIPAIGLAVAVFLMLELGFKHGFTRQDLGHEASYWAMAGFAFIALSRWLARPGPVLAVAAAALVLIPTKLPDPFAARNQWRTGVEYLVNESYRAQRMAEQKQLARRQYQFPDRLLADVRGHPVSVDPFETTLVWAYSLQWSPTPVIQHYAAYTPYLDDLNARFLVNAPADQRVIRERVDSYLDKRNPRWETPRYLLALACHYTVTATEGRWTVLSHDVNRCSQPQSVATRAVAAGEVIDVPMVGPEEILVTRFTPEPTGLLTDIVQAALKDWSPIMVTTDDGTYRVPEGLTDGPLLTAFPASLGWGSPFDGFRYSSLSFNHAGTVEFEVVSTR